MVCDAIVATISPKAIVLFGSFACGQMTDQSDIDLLILLNSQSEISSARKAVARIRPLSAYPLDVIWMAIEDYRQKRETGGIAEIAHAEGKLIYGDAF